MYHTLGVYDSIVRLDFGPDSRVLSKNMTDRIAGFTPMPFGEDRCWRRAIAPSRAAASLGSSLWSREPRPADSPQSTPLTPDAPNTLQNAVEPLYTTPKGTNKCGVIVFQRCHQVICQNYGTVPCNECAFRSVSAAHVVLHQVVVTSGWFVGSFIPRSTPTESLIADTTAPAWPRQHHPHHERKRLTTPVP